MVTEEDIYNYMKWKHRIEFDDGKFTPGTYGVQWTNKGLPKNIEGKTLLEVGSYDGMYAFEAEKRGADEVMATDIWELDEFEGSNYDNEPNKKGFNLIHEYTNSSVKSKSIDLMDVSPETVGKYDIVLCLSGGCHRTPLTLWSQYFLGYLLVRGW